ncbi:hypothetical protein BH10PSE14_BH10PSE14_37090 [soil metagenome]
MSEFDQAVVPAVTVSESNEQWVKPEVISYAPVGAAQGISYKPNDGLSNLS